MIKCWQALALLCPEKEQKQLWGWREGKEVLSHRKLVPIKSSLTTSSRNLASVQFSLSVMSNSLQLHGPQHAKPPCPSPTPCLLKSMSIESVMPSNHLILCCPLLLLPSIFPSIRVFSNESALCIRWPMYLEFQLQHQSLQ